MKKLILLTTCLAGLLQAPAYAEDKLIYAIDIIRHGDRTPTIDMPNSPHQWEIGLGQLTPEGMQQEFTLGTQMRQRYVNQYHLLPAKYNYAAMYVRSTNVDRTLMSAQSLLYGLYPLGEGPEALPMSFQPIPVHTIKKEEEILLIPDQDEKKFNALLQRYVYTKPEWKQKSAALQEKLKEWSKITGLKINNLRDLIALGDNLFIRQHYQVALPLGLTQKDADEIIATSRWAFTQIFGQPEVAERTANELLREMHKQVDDVIAKKTERKFTLYSAHDSTIVMILGALHVVDIKWPRYASDLNFSVYENAVKQIYIKVSLNGEPVTIPACRGDVCSLTGFKMAINSIRN